MHHSISAFDMFKIGVGPSSSHTLGPWRAAEKFCQHLITQDVLLDVESIRIVLYGSLAKTGKGHGTDIAIQLGLSGEDPVTVDVEMIDPKIKDIASMRKLMLSRKHEVDFNPQEDIEYFLTESLPYHSNALTFFANLRNGEKIAQTYYSIGGGFVEQEHESVNLKENIQLPFPVNNASDLLHWSMKTGLSIHEIVLENFG